MVFCEKDGFINFAEFTEKISVSESLLNEVAYFHHFYGIPLAAASVHTCIRNF